MKSEKRNEGSKKFYPSIFFYYLCHKTNYWYYERSFYRVVCAGVVMLLAGGGSVLAQRTEKLLTEWKFSHADKMEQTGTGFDDRAWECVCVPHDWAINGPFDNNLDKQTVAIEQNGENVATEDWPYRVASLGGNRVVQDSLQGGEEVWQGDPELRRCHERATGVREREEGRRMEIWLQCVQYRCHSLYK